MSLITSMKMPLAITFSVALSASAFANNKAFEDAQFKSTDTNRDGKISMKEHTASAQKQFDAMDADKNGKVTESEMTAFHDKMMVRKNDGEMSSAEKIKEVDEDGDGILASSECSEGARVMFRSMDSDSDGFLTRAEMAAGHDKLLKKKSS